MIQGKLRWCIWVEDQDPSFATEHPYLRDVARESSPISPCERCWFNTRFCIAPYRFVQIAGKRKITPSWLQSFPQERRPYIPVTLLSRDFIASDLLFRPVRRPAVNMALIASRLHLVWIATVCGKLKTDFRYSNTLGWNTRFRFRLLPRRTRPT